LFINAIAFSSAGALVERTVNNILRLISVSPCVPVWKKKRKKFIQISITCLKITV
tara:strand:- start:68 stop:232 length:165 start_codon:yes stop_codon:yes gene_type:complete